MPSSLGSLSSNTFIIWNGFTEESPSTPSLSLLSISSCRIIKYKYHQLYLISTRIFVTRVIIVGCLNAATIRSWPVVSQPFHQHDISGNIQHQHQHQHFLYHHLYYHHHHHKQKTITVFIRSNSAAESFDFSPLLVIVTSPLFFQKSENSLSLEYSKVFGKSKTLAHCCWFAASPWSSFPLPCHSIVTPIKLFFHHIQSAFFIIIIPLRFWSCTYYEYLHFHTAPPLVFFESVTEAAFQELLQEGLGDGVRTFGNWGGGYGRWG